ncbi:MAG: hypothetical protein MUQ52_01390, partial [Pirellulales bacterium]|nr:hypothetical protein [Pirellulales bacterium]
MTSVCCALEFDRDLACSFFGRPLLGTRSQRLFLFCFKTLDAYGVLSDKILKLFQRLALILNNVV